MVFQSQMVTPNKVFCSRNCQATYRQSWICLLLLWPKTLQSLSSLPQPVSSAAVLAAFEPPCSVGAGLSEEDPNHAF